MMWLPVEPALMRTPLGLTNIPEPTMMPTMILTEERSQMDIFKVKILKKRNDV